MLERTKGAMPINMYIITRLNNGTVEYITEYGATSNKDNAMKFWDMEDAMDFAEKFVGFFTFKIERI